MTKYVYDFAEGNKDLKDLLGGKGANLAEMTNLGLPVPPGFTITTEACKDYLRHRQRARRSCASEVVGRPRRAREGDGQEARRGRRPAAGLGALRREVLHARHDGDRPQHRAQRPVGGGPGQADRRQRPLRLGLLPAADPDVRQDRARHRRRAVRGRARGGQEGARAPPTTSTWTPTTCKELVAPLQGDHPRADRRATSRRTRASSSTWPIHAVFDSWNADAGGALPPPGADPGRPRHRGQRRGDGVRQPRHGLRHRRRLHPRPGQRRRRASTATTCRTRRARTSSPASATPCRCTSWSGSTSRPTTS